MPTPPLKKRRRAGKEPSDALAALLIERDKLTAAPSTRGVIRRREELPGEIDGERAKLARIREEAGKEVPAEPTGLVDQHEEIMMTFARANDFVIMWRPVNSEAAAKLEGQYRSEGELIGQYKGKALNTKGKSSVYPPIAADIPFDVRLSKVQNDLPHKVPEFQEKNNKSLEDSTAALHRYRQQFAEAQGKEGGVKLAELVREANEEMLVTRVDKNDNEGCPVLYIIHNERNDIFQKEAGVEESLPVFVIQKEATLFKYNHESGKYDQEFQLPSGYHQQSVQILAYTQFALDKASGTIEETVFPITSDYDELASIGRKIYPFLNNKEGIRTRVSSDLHKKLAHHGTNPVDPREVVASVVLEYELQQKRDHRDLQFEKGMGIVNELQWASKIFLKGETDTATNHGPEVNSPFPQLLSDARYPAHLPNGQVQVLHNEQEICDFINAQRKEGFPLDVNPKWSWVMDESGDLVVPEKKFDWELVHDGLRAQKIEMEGAEQSQKEGAAGELEELTARHVDDGDLMNMKVKIERLRLESDIIYSQVVDNTGREPEEDAEEKTFRLAVEKEVRRMEREVSSEQIVRLEENYDVGLREYLDKYADPALMARAGDMVAGVRARV